MFCCFNDDFYFLEDSCSRLAHAKIFLFKKSCFFDFHKNYLILCLCFPKLYFSNVFNFKKKNKNKMKVV